MGEKYKKKGIHYIEQNKKLKLQNDCFKTKLKEYENDIKTLVRIRDDLIKENSNTTKKLSLLETNLEHSKLENENLKEEVKNQAEDNEKLSFENNVCKKQSTAMYEKNTNLNHEIQQLKKDQCKNNNLFEEKICKLQNQIIESNENFNKSKNLNSEYEKQIIKLNKENDLLKKQNEEKLDLIHLQNEKEKEHLRQELEKLIQDSIELKEHNVMLEHEETHLHQIIYELEENLADEKNKNHQIIYELEENLADEKNKNEEEKNENVRKKNEDLRKRFAKSRNFI